MYDDLLPVTLTPGNYKFMCIGCDSLASGLATFMVGNSETSDLIQQITETINIYTETAKEPYDADEMELCIAVYEGVYTHFVTFHFVYFPFY